VKVLHVLAKLLQTRFLPALWPQAKYSEPVHCTHSPALVPASALASVPASPSDAARALQTPFPEICEQSEFDEQGSHLPLTHADAAASAQSDEARHSTQTFFAVSQSGVVPVQLPLPVHGTQTFVSAPPSASRAVLHAGVVPEQFVSLTHCTQTFVVASQTGVAPEQLPSLVHWTQLFVAILHAALAPLQFPSEVHSTQVLAESLQTGLAPEQTGLHAEVTPPVAVTPPTPVTLPPLVLPPIPTPPPLAPPVLPLPPLMPAPPTSPLSGSEQVSVRVQSSA